MYEIKKVSAVKKKWQHFIEHTPPTHSHKYIKLSTISNSLHCTIFFHLHGFYMGRHGLRKESDRFGISFGIISHVKLFRCFRSWVSVMWLS